MNKIIEIIKKRWLKDIFLTIILITMIFAIYFLINWGVEKLDIEDIDLTANKIYTLSESSKVKVKDIEKEVKIELINLSNNESIFDFAKKYERINSNIKVEQIDNLEARPDIMSEYQMQSTDSAIIFKSEERETILTTADLVTYDYTTYEQIDITEEAFTNAIIKVTIEDKPKIYFLEGHNVYPEQYFQVLKQDLDAESNEIDNLNILSAGSVPEDCDCLVITALKEDLTQMEKDKIIEYISNEGKLLILADPNVTGVKMPNFDEILSLYGLKISEGVLFEQDTTKMVYGSPEFIISQINNNSPIVKNINMNMNICVIDAAKLEFEDEEKLEKLGVESDIIAYTSDTAFLRTNFNINTYNKTNQDTDAANSIIATLATKKLEDDKKSELIIYSNTVFATNQQINIGGSYAMLANMLCNNDDVIKNSISYLTQRTDTITIRKDYDDVSYTVTEAQHRIIMAVIFGIPILIIIMGIIVWQIRRRKK